MPRRNRSRRDLPRGDVQRIMDVGVRTETYDGRSYQVRSVRGNNAGRTYVCPGCQADLASTVAHEVVWPADGLGDISDRRHWHTPCWRARDRRPPQGSWR